MNIQVFSEEIDGLTNIFGISKEFNDESIVVLKINIDKTIEKITPELIGNRYIKTSSPLPYGTTIIVLYEEKAVLLLEPTNARQLIALVGKLDARINTLEKAIKNRVTHKELSRIPSEQFQIPFIG